MCNNTELEIARAALTMVLKGAMQLSMRPCDGEEGAFCILRNQLAEAEREVAARSSTIATLQQDLDHNSGQLQDSQQQRRSLGATLEQTREALETVTQQRHELAEQLAGMRMELDNACLSKHALSAQVRLSCHPVEIAWTLLWVVPTLPSVSQPPSCIATAGDYNGPDYAAADCKRQHIRAT